VNFCRTYFQLREASLLPRPQRPGGPRLLIGATARSVRLRLAARYADEWNAVFQTPRVLHTCPPGWMKWLNDEGRKPEALRRSMMTGIRFALSRARLESKLHGHSVEELRGGGMIVGVGQEILPQLAELEQAGVQRVMLQWMDLEDLEGLEALGKDCCEVSCLTFHILWGNVVFKGMIHFHRYSIQDIPGPKSEIGY